MLGGYLNGVWKIFGTCLEGVWRLLGGEGVWKVFDWCLLGIKRMCVIIKEGVWRGCLESVQIFLDPNFF